MRPHVRKDIVSWVMDDASSIDGLIDIYEII